jgi:5-methylcytosine-specific restriction protein A
MPTAPKQFVPSWKVKRIERKTDYHHLYDRKWAKQRQYFLYDNPMCAFCLKEGKFKSADVVDHIKPHKGDLTLFWDTSNWQPLCKFHHDSTKQRIESRDRLR